MSPGQPMTSRECPCGRRKRVPAGAEALASVCRDGRADYDGLQRCLWNPPGPGTAQGESEAAEGQGVEGGSDRRLS